MFEMKNPKAIFPQKMPRAERHAESVKEEVWTEINGQKLRKGMDFMTQEGLQEYMVQREDVDILLLGSQPGCGKTAGLLLGALDGIDKKKEGMAHGVLFVKKQLVSTKDGAGSITQDAKVFYDFGNSTYTMSENPTWSFPQWNTTITFTHANFPETQKGVKDMQEKFKNFQCARIFVDEATDFPFSTFTYLQSRNRDTSGVKPRMICTFNVNSWHWTRRVIDWWLMKDPETGMRIADPAKVGRIRYACFQGNTPEEIVWGDSKEEVVRKANIVVPEYLRKVGLKAEDMVKAVAFRPAIMSENMEMLAATQGRHAANVFNTGGTETRKLWLMDWDAEDESPSQVTCEMINSAFDAPVDGEDEVKYGTADISQGGDACVFIPWRGHTIENFELVDASDPQRLPIRLSALLQKYNIPIENFAYDATGSGQYLKGFINGRPIFFNSRTIQEYDDYGNISNTDSYYNLRSQLHGITQYLFESHQIACEVDCNKLYPHGRHKTNQYISDILKDEKEVFRTIDKNNKIYYRSKKEYKGAHGYSPDFMDAITLRAVFDIDNPNRKVAEPEYDEEDYYAGIN